jgi:hypothetical protein
MPPWWAFVLFGMNALTLFFLFALNVWTEEVNRALQVIEKSVADLTARY